MLLRPIMIVLSSTLLLNATSTVEIPYQQCSKYPYANLIGGTMHSRLIQKKKLLKEASSLVHFSVNEALIKIQKSYPDLQITQLAISVKNCFVYFKGTSHEKSYYFDAGNLALKSGENR